ncbi:MAG: sugar phosphate nucleotidyltransferase [Oscillospiraceae bacterium]
MKAIIMAGGEGTRLRPVSHGCPKPMTRLLGRPIMEHIVNLLRRHGFSDICVTLCSQPNAIRDYFGNGSAFGVNICYREETEPLGTAGGIKNCVDFIEMDDVLIISGDAACDFDLTALWQNHHGSRSVVTIALAENPDPLRYGLVLTDKLGQVVSFIEKPDWSRVVTDLVNTGIYVVSPLILDLISDGERYDFAQDLFPKMMALGIPIRGSIMSGYWCDVGNPAEYLRCSVDALRGKLRLEDNSAYVSPGVRCGSRLPKNVKLHTPCLVPEGVVIGEGAEIGPDTVISPGSIVGREAQIRASVVDGAEIGANCVIEGSIVCRGAIVKPGEILKPGSIIGAPGAEKAPKRASLAVRQGECGRAIGEIPCYNRARMMRHMSEVLMEAGADFSDGLIIERRGGKVRLSPASNRDAIVIESLGKHAPDSSLAEECTQLANNLSLDDMV